jgi:carbon monoxide dehydrogenase subunit G
MESKFESKIGQVNVPAERLYAFFSNFNNLKGMIPPSDKIKKIEVTEDTINITADMVGDVLVKIIEREPNKLVKIQGENKQFPFFFWFQLVEAAPMDTRIRLTLSVELNPMIKMMVSKQIQKFLDELVDRLSGFKM